MNVRPASTVLRSVLINENVEIAVGSLGPEMDAAFDRFYPELVNGVLSLTTEFNDSAHKYLDSTGSDPAATDRFFNCFTPIWNLYLQFGRLDLTQRLWPLALQPVEQWEDTHHRVHKGTAYYFWAMSSLLEGNIDRGYVLAHQAVEEDSLTHGRPNPDTPAFALVSLNFDKPDQAFRPWVQDQAKYFDGFVTDYRAEHGRGFTMEDLKRKFLSNPPSIDLIFSLTHAVARLKEIYGLPQPAKQSSFVAQIHLNLLFDLLLVIDNAIQAKNPTKWKFSEHARFLLDQSGDRLALADFDAVHGQFKSDFNAALLLAIQGNLASRSTVLSRAQCDVVIAYELRNRGAHDVEAVPTITSNLDAVQRAVFRAFCRAIDFLF
jgi:hypothetical protein